MKIYYNPVLMYHRINDYDSFMPEIRTISVNCRLFKKQIEFLVKKNYNFLTFKNYAELFESNNLKPKDICITFDDGWEDNYIFAFPILKQHNIKATFFIISGYIDSDETLPAWRKSLNQNKHRFMKSEQIQELIDYGMEIGCHTMSHKRLTQIEGESAEKEIINSKKFLEEKFRIKIDSFSYPYGDHSKSIIEITKKAGFKAACVVTHGREISFNNRDIFKIEREFISNDSIFKLKLKLSGIKKFIRKLF